MIYIYIYIYIHIYIYRCRVLCIVQRISIEIYRWAIIEELSIRRRLRIFLISWGQKTRVKHCYVELSLWYEFWFAMICINMNIISDRSTTILQFYRRFRFIASKQVNGSTREIFLMQRQGTILAPMCLCKGKMWKSNAKNIFHIISRSSVACRSEVKCQTTWYSSFHLPCTQPAIRAAKRILDSNLWSLYRRIF